MSINVKVFPDSSENPYITNFYRGLDPAFVQVIEKVKGGGQLEADVLHIQWPEAWTWNKKEKQHKLKFILKCIFKRKFTGLKIVNTVHNLEPHKKQSMFQKVIYWYILRSCDGFIHLTEAGRELFFQRYSWASHKKNAVIFHPCYKAQLTEITKNEARKELGLNSSHLRIVFFGRILPYKGANQLVDSYLESSHTTSSSLWIGGPSDTESTKEIASKLSKGCQVEFSPGFVSDETLELQVKAADWVVLPYLGGLNSGVAIYALSCGTRAIVPDSSVMKEMAGVTQSDSFKYFSEGEFPEQLNSVLVQGRIESPVPNTTMLDSEVIGTQYYNFLTSL